MVAVLAYCFLLFWSVSWLFEAHTILSPLSRARSAFYFEPTVILLCFLLCLALTRRVVLSLVLITGFYIVFMLINAEMVRVFGLVFSPEDIRHSLQVFIAPEVWLSYWPQLSLMLLLLVIAVWVVIKSKPNPTLDRHRTKLLLTFGLVLVLVTYHRNTVADTINNTFRLSGKVIPINLSEHNGFLFGFLYKLLNHRPVEKPVNYSQQAITEVLARYRKEPVNQEPIKPHVIIFFIEAFADPQQMGIKTSHDPIPNFRAFSEQSQSGLVLSPELGGRSANPEFELLTGLSMRFVPEKSIPYMDYLNRPFPSLSREFKANGYTSHVIHVASMAYFNYQKAYPYLGFDQVKTLFGQKHVEKDPPGRYPSENALVDEIIRTTENSENPQFIFSFPNSTHSHWDYDAYDDSDLEVYGNYLEDGARYLKTYINALHTADLAIGRLIQHYQKEPHPTIVLVLGDHQPSLPEFRQSLAEDFFAKQGLDENHQNREHFRKQFVTQLKDHYQPGDPMMAYVHRKSHQVPYFIWNNFDNQPHTKNTSMNLLSAQLLAMAQTPKSPLYELVERIYQELHELDKRTVVDEQHKQLVDDYALLQYDIMSGNQYALTEPE